VCRHHAFRTVGLDEPWATFLADRYLPGVDGYERAATWYLLLHNRLRLVATIAGIGAPVLLGVDLAQGASAVNVAAFALSLLTSGALAIEVAFGVGDRWRHCRRAAEALKREGWLFLTLSDRYVGQDRETATRAFHERVESIVELQVDVYLDEVSRERGPLPTG
jgi:hypothetical protein